MLMRKAVANEVVFGGVGGKWTCELSTYKAAANTVVLGYAGSKYIFKC
jgi:hypothetical protein